LVLASLALKTILAGARTRVTYLGFPGDGKLKLKKNQGNYQGNPKCNPSAQLKRLEKN